MLKEGDKAPVFTIETDKNIFELKFKNDKKTIIFFFPRADTSGCTKEAIDFSLLLEQFQNLNAQIIGISKDSVMKQQKFKTKHMKMLIVWQKWALPSQKNFSEEGKKYFKKQI